MGHASTTVSRSQSFTKFGVNATPRCTAKATGLSNTTVKWKASVIVSSNSMIGATCAKDLYKAPAIIPAVSNLVDAIAAYGAIGCQYVKLEPVRPTIPAINPSPNSTRSYLITIAGNRYSAGAAVGEGGSDLTTTYVNDTTLKTADTQYGATLAKWFCVTALNPAYFRIMETSLHRTLGFLLSAEFPTPLLE